ncbi:hypothetical protein ALI144C_27355 [Actinosynnema sp. ALI-1.44]|uniref:HAMP domain-containing sensor histidine kinase n=1 Tax=Actinosynnema sp. ALI-1.44 TaxID=1933779 RepID=UPI00097C3F23|nr:HAMP domain-containing sensor histidine kinase [Actinosynnema sp. ALI-1.44]ONI79511.1 hypothetical protein ALI144C_27355 [Actinosynnema sp. ALI-1.44]
MRHSLLVRLLALALGVAALSVCTVALLVTGDQGREELAGDASLLETDREIRSALHGYATEHSSWAGVDSLVDELARRTGRRIALTTPHGKPIVDSARTPNNNATALPKAPAARIDATTPPDDQALTLPPNIVAGKPAEGVLTVYGWRLTDGERRQWQAFADQAADCLRRTGAGARPAVAWYGRPITDAAGPTTSSGDPCVSSGPPGQTEAVRRLTARVAEESSGCPADPNSLLWTECLRDARLEVLRGHVAGPADLYLGESDRFDPLSPADRLRTAGTVAAVLIVAAAATVLVARRLVRPIRMLTAAAGRMAAGDRAARVPLRGNDEITQLAVAFNTMADAIDGADRHRQAMLDDVAHELRTPLANVRGYLDAAQDGVVPVDSALIRSLIEESELLERLVADLRDLALAEAGELRIHPEEQDVADLAAAAVAAHRAGAEACGVDLRFTVAEPVVMHVDPTRLRQALGNLVSNAVRHTPSGATVDVAVRGSADAVVITVADTGIGIAAEHLPHIFDRLYRADPSRGRTTGGAGLGLAITKYLVQAHHGRVEVTSTPGVGSTFTIRLPRTDAVPE